MVDSPAFLYNFSRNITEGPELTPSKRSWVKTGPLSQKDPPGPTKNHILKSQKRPTYAYAFLSLQWHPPHLLQTPAATTTLFPHLLLILFSSSTQLFLSSTALRCCFSHHPLLSFHPLLLISSHLLLPPPLFSFHPLLIISLLPSSHNLLSSSSHSPLLHLFS